MKIKSSAINNRILLLKSKIDTLYLDEWCYNGGKVSKHFDRYLLPNIKNLIISKNMIIDSYNKTVTIENSSAENIYLEDNKNLGGITINYNDLDKYYNKLEIKYTFNLNCNCKFLNIYNNDKSIKIDLKQDTYEIILYKANDKINLKIVDKKETIEYIIDELCNKQEEKIKYTLDSSDLVNGELDIRKYLDYNKIQVSPMDITTLIINQKALKYMSLLEKFNANKEYLIYPMINDSAKITLNNIRIIDENDMRLVPLDKTYSISNGMVLGYGLNEYLYIKSDDEILIYLDIIGNIKIVTKNELLKNNDIKKVKFYFDRNYYLGDYGDKCINLILLKYNNGTYKVINLDKTYELKEDFTKYLSGTNLDFIPSTYIKYLKENDWFKIFDDTSFDNILFNKMINSYKEYKKYIIKLKEYGLTEDAFNYLKYRNINEIITPSQDINFALEQKEVELLNELGENYKKVLRKSGD